MTMKRNNILGIIIIGVIVYFVFIGGDKWTGFYYLNRDDLSMYFNSSEFNSLEECRGWVMNKVRMGRPTFPLNYACGKNCRIEKYGGEHICEFTTY